MIISNERNVMDMARGKASTFDEGLFARLFEINVCGPYGAFHELHGKKTGADFAKNTT